MPYLVGIDGGGTRTTVALADLEGRELLRRTGPAGLIDPREPAASSRVLATLVRQAVQEAGLGGPAAALCAGLAGAGSPAKRALVRAELVDASLASHVAVLSDGEIALEGAFRGGPGILLIAGTGSVAHGRGEDGRTARCGGWGMVIGDEGSGYAIGRAALAAALRSVDGRGRATRLLAALLERLDLRDAFDIPPWAGRAAKSEIAALTFEVARVAGEHDAVAREILHAAAGDLAAHAAALAEQLGPWSAAPPVVFFGGVFETELFADLVRRALSERIPTGFRVQPPAEDAVAGAVRIAAGLRRGEGVVP